MKSQLDGLFWIVVLAVSAAAGILYNRLFADGPGTAAAIYGFGVGLALMLFERDVLFSDQKRRMRRWPGYAYLAGTLTAYTLLIVVAIAAAGTLVWAVGLMPGSWSSAAVTTPRILVYSLVISAIITFVIRMRDLIGAETFGNLLIGRYRRPVSEERVFLFVDLVGSTSLVEEIGDLRAQDFLGALFEAMAEPVRRCRGQIDDYVGDMAIVTWPLARGIEFGRCITCAFAIVDCIEADATRWRNRFGRVPKVRIALHGGSVVTAEIGVDRHKITYFGDTVNATARLEALGKNLDEAVLISTDLLDRLPGLPPGAIARDLGFNSLRGRDQPMRVFALGRAEDAQAAEAQAAAAIRSMDAR